MKTETPFQKSNPLPKWIDAKTILMIAVGTTLGRLTLTQNITWDILNSLGTWVGALATVVGSYYVFRLSTRQNELFKGQNDLLERQTQIDLFEYRYGVFQLLNMLLEQILDNHEISAEMVSDSKFASVKAICLFPQEVQTLTLQIFKRIERMSMIDTLLKQTCMPENSNERMSLIVERQNEVQWFAENRGFIGETLIKYIDLSKWHMREAASGSDSLIMRFISVHELGKGASQYTPFARQRC